MAYKKLCPILTLLGAALYSHTLLPEVTNLPIKKLSTDNCQLKMGLVLWPPCQYLTKSDQFAGIQAVLYKSIAKAAKCQLTFIEGNWQDIQSEIESGKVDMMGEASVTLKR